jgi:Fur family transcriptional regulator, ferric uptake regulator
VTTVAVTGGEAAPRRLEEQARQSGLRVNSRRRAVLHVIEAAKDQPTAREIYRRAVKMDRKLSMAAVYRTLTLLGRAGLISRIEFGRRTTRYELARSRSQTVLVDVDTGRLIEFQSELIGTVLLRAAAQLGYRLITYRLELTGAPHDEVSSARAAKTAHSGIAIDLKL